MKRFLRIGLAWMLVCVNLIFNMAVSPVYASEMETVAETEPQAVVLPTDKVSTDDVLLYSSAAIVMDVDTGAILYEKNKSDRHFPASTTKIMTTLLALERCNLDEEITFSEDAVYSITWDSSNMALEPGDSLTVEETLYGVMLRSANEAANGLGEYVSGSMEAFAEDMTEYAIELGCRRTHFTNASGLHNDEHYTTAKDLAIIASTAIQNETFAKIAGTVLYTVENVNYQVKKPETDEAGVVINPNAEPEAEPVEMYNHHKMVNHEYRYEGCFGGKTGYTDEARNTLVTYVERDGHRLVCVLMDCPGGKNYIYMDTETALDYCFAHYDQLNALWLKRQEALDYMPTAIWDWYAPSTPLSMEEMFFPYVKEAYNLYVPFIQTRAARQALDKAISEKSVEDFMEYSRFYDNKPLVVACVILGAALLVLIMIVIWFSGVAKRGRRRMRYKKMKKMRKTDDAFVQQLLKSEE